MQDYRIFLAIGLIVFSLWGNTKIPEYVTHIKHAIFKPAVVIIDVKPEDKYIASTEKIASMITDSADRKDLAILNLEFSKRTDAYLSKGVTSQQLVDLYTSSIKEHFLDRLKGKYGDLPTEAKAMFSSVIGEDEHTLSKEELDSVSKALVAFAWNLEN
jgi:hypothetical protein